MAVVELQIEESILLELLRTQFDRQRLPGPSVGLPGLAAKYLQRIRCANLSVQDSGSSGQVALATTVVVEYNDNLAEVRSAGSLRRPDRHELTLHPPATVAVVLPAMPEAAPAIRVSVPGYWSFDAPMIIPGRFSVQAGAMVAGERRSPTSHPTPPPLASDETSSWPKCMAMLGSNERARPTAARSDALGA